MNNVFTLKLKKEIIKIHLIDKNLYYFEDSTGMYKMNGNATDYVFYLENKGYRLVL